MNNFNYLHTMYVNLLKSEVAERGIDHLEQWRYQTDVNGPSLGTHRDLYFMNVSDFIKLITDKVSSEVPAEYQHTCFIDFEIESDCDGDSTVYMNIMYKKPITDEQLINYVATEKASAEYNKNKFK